MNEKVFQNFCNMLKNRGDTDELKLWKEDEKFTIYEGIGKKVMFSPTLNKELIIYFVNILKEDHGFIVYKKFATKTPKDIANLEFFEESFFFFDLTKSQYYRQCLSVDSCPYKKENLLKIKTTDPIVRYFNFKKGDIILVDNIEYNLIVG